MDGKLIFKNFCFHYSTFLVSKQGTKKEGIPVAWLVFGSPSMEILLHFLKFRIFRQIFSHCMKFNLSALQSFQQNLLRMEDKDIQEMLAQKAVSSASAL